MLIKLSNEFCSQTLLKPPKVKILEMHGFELN